MRTSRRTKARRAPTRGSSRRRDYWRQRFRKVILGAGYSESAAEGILADYLPQYLNDLPRFTEMLESYERSQFDPE